MKNTSWLEIHFQNYKVVDRLKDSTQKHAVLCKAADYEQVFHFNITSQGQKDRKVKAVEWRGQSPDLVKSERTCGWS